MKKTIVAFSSVIIAAFSLSATNFTLSPAFAQSEYLRVITRDTPIFSDERMTDFLFYLPYTYYVKVLGVNGDIAHVEYGDFAPALDGYVSLSLLYDDGLSVSSPYVSVAVETVQTAPFYKDSSLTSVKRYLFADRTLYYYGLIKDGEGVAYYVSYNGTLGYIKEDCVKPFYISDHPNELTFIKQENPDPPVITPEEEQPENPSLTVKILVIGSLILAGIVATFAVKRPKKSAEYYDENEFG